MLRVQAGDHAALGTLFERYARLVLSIGLRLLRDQGEAQDLVQDVFLQVYQKSHLFEPKKGAVRSWLTQIAYHRAFDRREYLNLHRFYDDRNLDDFADVIQASTNLEYEARLRQCESVLREAFRQLSEKQRQTLELYFFEGYTLREISLLLKETLANVRHYYYRGLERLRQSVDMSSLKDEQP
jgi:RNA polymerase sigma-70 factor (ECF subfamily)